MTSDTLYVLAASYDHLDDALSEYEAIRIAYRHVGSSHDFDATVIARNDAGKVEIVRKHDEPTRHGTAEGLTWGLAAGAVAALFPAIGILGALAVGGGAGAALGAVAGHAGSDTSRDDLTRLAQALDQGEAGMVVVYSSDMADQVAANVNAAGHTVRGTTRLTADQLAAEIREAEAPSANAGGR